MRTDEAVYTEISLWSNICNKEAEFLNACIFNCPMHHALLCSTAFIICLLGGQLWVAQSFIPLSSYFHRSIKHHDHHHHNQLISSLFEIKIKRSHHQNLSNRPRKSIMSLSSLSMVSLLRDTDALFLDCDGTIAETEKDLTLVQFNEAFKSVPSLSHIQWTPEEYGELLKVGVSQYRFEAYFEKHGYPVHIDVLLGDRESKKRFCYEMKELKDKMFEKVWQSQNIPLRPGILPLVQEAISNGIFVAVCSNSNTEPVSSICKTLFGPEIMSQILVIGGDFPLLQKKKKPAPDIYLLAASYAAQSRGVETIPSRRCLVIEDSQVGLQAALAAGMRCIVSPSYYTIHEDFTGADIVTSSLLDLLV